LRRTIAKPFDRDIIIKKIEKLGFDISQGKEETNGQEVLEAGGGIQDQKEQDDQESREIIQKIILQIVHKFNEDEIDLPVLPGIAQDIRKAMNEPNSTIDDLAQLIKKDAVISLRLISGANSPFYRGTEKIDTVEKAITRLGFIETGSVVNAIANKSLYSTKNKQFKILMEKLWMHSFATAAGAKVIADKLAFGHIERFFFMGLIHDIGKVLLLKALGDRLPQKILSNTTDILKYIQKVHTNFGAAIVKRWGFSQRYINAALLHEGPKFSPTTEKDILVVNLANNLAHKIGYSLVDQEVTLSDLDSAKLLKINGDTLEVMGKEVKEMVIGSEDIF